MGNLSINGKQIHFQRGETLLDIAERLGIFIPTLCYYKKLSPFTSCMVCFVEEVKRGELLPACSTRAEEKMIIETETPLVCDARQKAFELLFSEHLGDCEAPCTLTCPGGINIPLMIRQMKEGDFTAAGDSLLASNPFPGTTGKICSAPCERGCRRNKEDHGLAIKKLEYLGGSHSLSLNLIGHMEDATGKLSAVIGEGVSALSTAWFLTLRGHKVVLFSAKEDFQELIPEGSSEDVRETFSREVKRIFSAGVNLRVGFPDSMEELKKSFDAVVCFFSDQQCSSYGIIPADGKKHNSFETDIPGVFLFDDRIKEPNKLIKEVFEGRKAAFSVDLYLKGENPEPYAKPFNSRFGPLKEGDLTEFMNGTSSEGPLDLRDNSGSAEVKREADRCMRCDCLSLSDCKLRAYGDLFNVSRGKYSRGARKPFTREEDSIIFEEGKCIKCGICVRIARENQEPNGPAFLGRGFDLCIGLPQKMSHLEGMGKGARESVKNCPTGALRFSGRDRKGGGENE